MDTTKTTPPPTDTATLPQHLRVTPETQATRGERFVHTFAHTIINFFANYTLSIAITDLFLGYTPREKKVVTSTASETRDARKSGGKEHTPTYEVTTYADGSKSEKLASIKLADGTVVNRSTGIDPPQVTSYIAEKIPALRGFSDSCRKLYDGMKSNTFTFFNKTLGAGHKMSESISDIVVDVFTLMLGGHVSTTLATRVTNRSDKWARYFDNMFDSWGGKKPSAEEKAGREARYAELAAQPKLGVGTIITSRVLGFLMNTGMWSIVSTNVDPRRYKEGGTDLMELKGQRLGIRGATQYAGDKISGWAIKRNPGMGEAAQNRWKFWSELGLFELACTANTSIAHVIMSGLGVKKKPEASVATASSSAPSSRSDNAAPAQESAEPKEALADKKIARREEVKPREAVKPAEERRRETAGEALMATA